MDSLKTLPFI